MTSIDRSKQNWYVLYTKPRHEFKAALQLEEGNIQYYLPTVTRLKQWSDRKKKVTEPILFGYIFIYGTEKDRLLALEKESLIRSIFFEGKPAIVPEWQIDNLKKLLEGNPEIIVSEGIEVGTQVIITTGPFEGVQGVVTYSQNERTLAVSIEALHRSIIVTLPSYSVTKKVER